MHPSDRPERHLDPDGGGVRVGVDTGGTFTDLVARGADGTLRVAKVRSTPDDPGAALEAGLLELGPGPATLATIVHGTTVALNALLTGRLGETALVANRGFLDLVEIDRQARPDLYALEPERPTPLIPRERRFEVGQRSWPDPAGGGDSGRAFLEVERPGDDEIAALADAVAASGATSVAVCLLHSYADPEPERRIAAALRARGLDATASADLVPEYREAERFSTAVCNAALVPVMRGYLERLARRLPNAPLEVLQSSGGGLTAERAALEPVRVLLSGPAGGVVGAAHAARDAGLGAIATLDMGGTSTDVAFHAAGQGLGALGEGVRVAGHSIAVPTLDMHTIGCGGGSLARVDTGGILRVGPTSAGAEPGPVAFGRGGEEPTVTDAYVVLGRVPTEPHPGGFLGGTLRLDVDAAVRAYERLGRTLGASAERAAEAVVLAANASMRRALGVMTMQRGRDPRRTPLVAFGGGGGLAGAELARALGMPSTLVPSAPGALSAYGMTRAERTCDRSRSVLMPVEAVDREERESTVRALGAAALDALNLEALERGRVSFETSLALRYAGQSYELAIPGDAEPESAFHAAHEARFGWRLDGHPVELVHLRVRATLGAAAPAEDDATDGSPADAATVARSIAAARVGAQRVVVAGMTVSAQIYDRTRLAVGAVVAGPALLDEYSGTTYLPPDARATVVRGGGLLIEDER